MYNDVITLIGAEKTINQYGDIVEDETETKVFASIKSVGSKRKLEALAVGLRLEWKFVLPDYYEYDGQEKVRYNGVVYEITDTYRAADNSIELTVRRC